MEKGKKKGHPLGGDMTIWVEGVSGLVGYDIVNDPWIKSLLGVSYSHPNQWKHWGFEYILKEHTLNV